MSSTAIEAFFDDAPTWRNEMTTLRPLVLAAGLDEDWKWKQPCYTAAGKNVVMIAPFARYCALAFFQGVLLDDPAGLLVTPGANSQSARQLRFTSVDEIEEHREAIDAFLAEAVTHAEQGTAVSFTAKDELVLPAELLERFDTVDGLEAAFTALTPGRQRGFVLHIDGAKKQSTRLARVDKHTERILAGKGIHDCVCGKSARMPRCDGSHAR